MVLLIPITPEVPKQLRPQLWPSLILVLLILVGYLETRDIVNRDYTYVQQIQPIIAKNLGKQNQVDQQSEDYLQKRPLLQITPSKASWDIKRLIIANFVHGSLLHLSLNIIGVFAGVRICTTFIPFILTLFIFIFGGSVGLFLSMFLGRDISPYVPHLGASAGIFALMGTYYIYNFQFRTKYFFWFPGKAKMIALTTSWFFFLDVLNFL